MHYICKVIEKNNDEYLIEVNKDDILYLPKDPILKKIYCSLDLPINECIYSLESKKIDDKVYLVDYLILTKPIVTQITESLEGVSELIQDSTKYPIDIFLYRK